MSVLQAIKQNPVPSNLSSVSAASTRSCSNHMESPDVTMGGARVGGPGFSSGSRGSELGRLGYQLCQRQCRERKLRGGAGGRGC